MNVYAALSHPLREKILRFLDSERLLAYKDLMDRLGIQETGLLNYHLGLLRKGGFIEKREGLYRLSAEGRNAIRLMLAKEQLMAGEPIELQPSNGRGPIHRIGVIICSCGADIGQTVNMPILIERVSEISHVVSTRKFDFLCILENVEKIKEWSERNFINGLVIAACSPRLHHEIFSTIGKQLDLPVEFANIREHCSWVHKNEPERATEKALLLISASVAMLRYRVPIPKNVFPIRKSVAIIGGGLAGLTAASVLSKSNYPVILIERDYCLGGIARKWAKIHESIDCSPCMITEQVSSVVLAGNMRIFTNTELTAVSGNPGNYEITATQYPRYVDMTRCTLCRTCTEVCPKSKSNEFEMNLGQHTLIHLPCPFAYPNKPVIDTDDIEYCRNCRKCEENCPSHAIDLSEDPETLKFTVGAVIFASGAALSSPELVDPALPVKYNPGKDVITSYEFERMLASDGPTGGQILRISNGKPARSVAILQCINSTVNCSKFCCDSAKKYINMLAGHTQKLTVNVLYQNSRMPPNRTELIPNDTRIHQCKTLEIEHEGKLRRLVSDTGKYPADLIVLNMGMTSGEELSAFRSDLNFTLDDGGYLKPFSLPTGIWACGSITGPKPYKELEMESRNAALEALLFLGKNTLEAGDKTVKIDSTKCGFCGLCVEACPHNAITLAADNIKIDPFKCGECGVCTAICPTGALTASSMQDEVKAAIAALSQGKSQPRILVLCCESCGYPAVDNAGINRLEYDPGIVVLGIPCTGCVDADFVLSAIQNGFDGVVVVGCHDNSCRYIDGIKQAKSRIETLKSFYGESLKNRVRILNVSALEGQVFTATLNEFAKELKRSVKV
jgi:heterodisulfide reductase subunit A-like polyferredoxin/coenzyme F420-reducing hydrogenase delta subunit